ncbi:MAG: PSD1 and planctomycete cytochrome C domain-containing protein [Gemmataceae bacterium]
MLLGCVAAPPARADDLFEAKVRPVLVEHCYKCHSQAGGQSKGGLRLDTRDGVRTGGDRGPAVVPGDVASLLLRAVRHTDPDLKMPPKGKLTASQIAALEEWVRAGAPDPRGESSPKQPASAGSDHWAFRPVQAPGVPAVKHAGWVRTPVDAYILAKLESRGLTPSPAADKRTLLRRVYFDLIGLPPTWDESRAFETDPDPAAFAKVVDRLLASPRYGERWGRHWLDVARYADTKDGVLLYGDDRIRPFAYTYRDWVIRAFNDDLPFDRFVQEQIAADRLPPDDPGRLAALGFLTLGRQFDNNVHDIIDDRIDTVTRGFLGLTVSCARCHDHKYDPVPVADYYSLYGVFANSEAPLVSPPVSPDRGPEAFEKAYAAKCAEIQKALDSQYALLSETARTRVADYLVRVSTTDPDPLETAIFFFSLSPEDLRPPITGRWRSYLAQRAVPGDPVFDPWHRLFAVTPDQMTAAAKSLPVAVNPIVRAALSSAKLASRADVARVYGELLSGVYRTCRTRVGPPTAPESELLAVLAGPDSPAYFPKSQTRKYMSRADTDHFGGLLQQLDKLAVKEPNAPPRAVSLVDATDLTETRVFVRGNPARLGPPVPRQFLTAVRRPTDRPFADGSGRLELAQAITDPANPLTARVFVNRVWLHHFGTPLVDTPNDFGLRTARPVQAELLDHLAAEFRRTGGSVKALHRHILLSNAYQQASFDRADCRASDPDNALYWRVNRQRLDLEAMRDAMLTVSGRVEHKLYGRPVDVAGDPANRRRTVYGLVDRQSLPGLFRAFDFASPDQSAERRPSTTVPQQALFGLNSPFVLEQAKSLAARPDVANATDPAGKVWALYRLVLGREPGQEEVHAAVAFATNRPADGSKLSGWEMLAQTLLLTNEFLFID